MLALRRITLRSLVAVGLLAVTAAGAQAQLPQPQVKPQQGLPNLGQPGVWNPNQPWNPNPWNPNFQNPAFPNPSFPWHKNNDQQQNNQGRSPIMVMPSINTMPGLPASNLFPPIMTPPSWLNPALNNPWMNQTVIVPVPRNRMLMNPFFNNPLALNPLLQRAQWYNEMNLPGHVSQSSLLDLTPLAVDYRPPIATREPGQYFFRGMDLQVNPTTGTVYRPQSGIVTLADGTKFYRVPGTGMPTATGLYATGTGLYYNPDDNTFFNPRSGVLSKPGQTSVFLPYVW